MRLVNEVEIPTPGPGQVLVRVHAAALNFPDVLLCRGQYQVRPPLPFTPGRRAVRRGGGDRADVAASPIGDRVIGRALPDGALAEYALVDAASTRSPRRPRSTMPRRRRCTSRYQTGWFGLHRRARLQAGETLLVHAARRRGRQRGRAAGQGGRGAGDRGGRRARTRPRWPRELGADVVIDRRAEDFVAAVKEATGGRGADVVYDPVGGDAYAGSAKCVAFEGRILVVGFAGGTVPAPGAQPRADQELLDRRPALGSLQAARPGR